MRVKVLKNTVASGEKLQSGDTVEISDKDARILIGIGKAEISEEKPKRASKKVVAKKSEG